MFVPFYFHNLSGYDTHLFFKELIKHNPAKEVKLLANTEENILYLILVCGVHIRFDLM